MAEYYLDASFVLSLAKGRVHDALKVLEVLGGDHTLYASKLVELETLSPAIGAGLNEEVKAIRDILTFIDRWLSIDDTDLENAKVLSSRNKGLAAADAIHLGLCEKLEIVFANAERNGRVPNSIPGIEAYSIHSSV